MKNDFLKNFISKLFFYSPSEKLERVFDIKFNNFQKDSIDSCLNVCFDRRYSCRQSEATTAAIFEAIYLSLFCGKKILFVTKDKLSENFIIREVIVILKNIQYTLIGGKFQFNNRGSILMQSLPNVTNFSKRKPNPLGLG